MSARCSGVCLLILSLIATGKVWAQAAPPASTATAASAPATSEAPADALGRTTPRGTVRGFLTEAGKGDNEGAARYLNTRLPAQTAALLAHELFVVLNRRLPAKLNEISDKPEGSQPYPAEPDKDLIGTISGEAGNVDIVVERVERKNASAIWLFSRKTLDQIPELYADVESEPTETGVLKFLLETKIASIALLHWVAFFIGLPLLNLLAIRLNRTLSPLVGRLLRRLGKNPDLPDPEILPVPVRILLLAILIRRTLAVVTLPLLARQAWSSIAVTATIVGIVWCFVRLIGYAEKNFRLRFGRRNLNGGLSILRFVCSALDGLIIFIGLLFLLHHFGINATTALAGLGVGGIAIALAAQKTLENVIAGISLISDKAIRVGDFLKMADTLGTVTDIGLRSTRIRTLDRTIVNLPNGQIANASLENYSLRDQFWFHPIVRLSYETTVAQLRSILEEITALMRRYSGIDLPSVRARLLQFGESSLDIEIFAYLYAADYPDFLRIQEDLLLQIMDVIEAAGARIAVPARSMYVNTPGNRESDREPASRMLIHEPVTQNK